MELPGVAEYETSLAVALALTGVRSTALAIAAESMGEGPLDRRAVLRRTLALVETWSNGREGPVVADVLSDDLASSRFWSAVRTLPAIQGRSIVLSLVAGLDTADTAAVLGQPAGVVDGSIVAARTSVATLLGVTGTGSSLRHPVVDDAADLGQWAP